MRTRRSGKVAEADSSLGNVLDNLHRCENDDAKDATSASAGLTLDDVSRQDVEKLLDRVSDRRGAAVKKRLAQERNSGKRGSKRKLEVDVDEPLFGQRSASLSGSIYARAASVADTSRCGTLAKTKLDEDVYSINEHNDERPSKKVKGTEAKLQRNSNVISTEESTPTQYKTDDDDDDDDDGARDVVPTRSSGEDDEFDWEDGGIGSTFNGNFKQDTGKEWNGEVTVDVKGSAGTGVATRRKPSKRRATAKDKEFAEMVHKAHLLCLLARGRVVDAACDDPVLQASILSLLPPNLGLSTDAEIANPNVLGHLVSWFMSSFRILSPGEGSSSSNQEEFSTRLLQSLQKQAGSAEEVTALSVAFLRALGFTTRYVMVLDVVPLKPDADSLEASEDWESHSPGMNFSHHYDIETTKVASLARILARSAPLQSNHNQNKFLNGEGHSHPTKSVESQMRRAKGRKPSKTELLVTEHEKDILVDSTASPKEQETGRMRGKSEPSSESQLVTRVIELPEVGASGSGQKRRGDEEYERDLAMAIAATSAVVDIKDLEMGETLATDSVAASHELPSSAAKKLKGKGPGFGGNANWRKKVGLIPKQEGGSSISAHCARKLGPMRHWAEVYCSGKGKVEGWLHVDAARGVVDGADKVEAVSRLPLCYVVAFAGRGAKDVTRRYVSSWSAISPLRVDESWWDGTLNPLKQLEAAASAGVTFRDPPEPSKSSWNAAHSHDTSTKDTNGFSETDRPMLNEGISLSGYMQPEPSISESKALNAAAGHSLSKISPRQLDPAGICADDRSALEDMEMETKTFTEPLPTSQQAYKSHHLYALERWLTKYQTLHPRGPVLGFCAGHAVYPRTCVQILHTTDRWLREGFKVKDGELPAKVVKASRYAGSAGMNGKEENTPAATTALYGMWQTNPWQPPAAVNGIVPKNERGQVDALSDKCIPPGTVHLRFPRLVPIANALGIDFAPAMVGFEIRKGRSFPVYEGIVVCEEFKDVILDAYEHQEEVRFHDLQRKREEHAVKRWRQLFQSMATRQQLQAAYESSVSVDTTINQKGENLTPGIGKFSRMDTDVTQPADSPKKKGARKLTPSLEPEHVHDFPEENQSYDEESGIRTKRCSCGFTFYVEEM